MAATSVIALLAGAVIVYSAVRMIRSREFTVRVTTAGWNPQGRMFVRIFGLDPWVNITQKVVAPVLMVVGIGLWIVAAWLVAEQGK